MSNQTETDAVFVNLASVGELIVGDNTDELLVGGDGDDTIFGAGGGDTVEGGGGGDELSGNQGDDSISGGGGNDTILGSSGDDWAQGGAGIDRLDGGTGNDTVDYSDALAGWEIALAEERATSPGVPTATTEFIFSFENAVGGDGDDTLLGTDGGNRLQGGPGNDSLAGGGGDDTLAGDPGNDTLDGGPGNDTADYAHTHVGAVFDLQAGRVVSTDGATDDLTSIENIIAGQGDDTVNGGDDGEFLDGQGGDDVLVGNGGNDTVLGGTGNDSLVAGLADDEGPDGDDVYVGGAGNDTISFESTTDGVTVDLGAESATGSETGDDTVTGIENVFGGSGDDTITGDAEDNVLCGNEGGDLINGADGADTLVGGGGDDTIDGGAGNDVMYGDSAAGLGEAGLTIRFISESALYKSTYGWYDTSTLDAQVLVSNTDVETNPAVASFVTSLALSAAEFDNLGFFLIPNGYALNRTELDGGDPGALNLEVFDDDGVWKIRDVDSGYEFVGGGSAAYFTEPAKNVGDLDHTAISGGLTTIGEEVQGWEDLPDLGDMDFNDVIFQLTLSCGLGLPGSDLLLGGAGNDTIFGGDQQDTLQGGAGDDRLRGNAGNDSLDGGDGQDILRGNAGNDTIAGGTGADTVYGGHGGDLILGSGSVADDHYNGGAGGDTVNYQEETEDVFVDLEAGVASGAGIGVDSLDGIENAVGGSGNDILKGSSADNQLAGNDGGDLLGGSGGNDILDGGGGDDTVSYETTTDGVVVDLASGTASGSEIDSDGLVDIENAMGGAGDDSLVGSGGANQLVGNGGDDTLNGGGGNDTLGGGDGDDLLLSGAGDDMLTGGEGADTFSFDLWIGTDTISDFTPASDKIDVSQFGFSNLFELGVLVEGALDGTWIRLSDVGGGDVLLEDVLIFNLTSDDFIL